MARNIRVRVPQLLEERKITPYRLMKDLKISPGAAYRLARVQKTDKMEGISFEMLAALCKYFAVNVDQILEYIPDDQ